MIRALRTFVVLLTVGLGLSCRDIEIVESEYATLSEAKADNAVERGFVPPWLPDGTVQIKTKHDIDTGWFALSFVVPDPSRFESAALGHGFRSVDRPAPEPPRSLLSWTPAPHIPRSHAFRGSHFHNNEEVVLIVDAETGVTWYWEE
jgi:hypothetical protein